MSTHEEYRLSALALCRSLLLPYDVETSELITSLKKALPEHPSIAQIAATFGADSVYAAATLLKIEWGAPYDR